MSQSATSVLLYDVTARPTSEGPAHLPSDSELVETVLAGDRGAYAALVRRYERTVTAVAWRVLGDREAAEEAAQDAFVTAYQKLSDLRQPRAFGGWLMRIVRRNAMRMAKERARTIPFDTQERIEEPAEAHDFALLDLVDRLPEHERAVVRMRYLDRLDVAAIAEALDRPVGTVTKQLSRAHARLRDWIHEGNEP